MNELRSNHPAEEFFKVIETATSIGNEYGKLLFQIHRYMKDNHIDWFDPGMNQFQSSVMAISVSTTTAVQDMNIDG